MNKELKKLKEQLLSMKKATEKTERIILLSKDEINELFKEYSEETREDINNNYTNGYLHWDKLKTETLKEVVFDLILIIGEGEDAVVIIDDIPKDEL